MAKLLFLGTPDDTPYIGQMRSIQGSSQILVSTAPVNTLFEITSIVRKRNLDGVLTSNLSVLQKLLGPSTKISLSEASINNYAGSWFEYQDIPFVIINPLQQLVSVPYGKFLARRYISKLASPESWMPVSEFNWRILDGANIETAYEKLAAAYLIAVDIETAKDPLRITCIGYTGIYLDGTSYSCVLPITSLWAVSWMRKLNLLAPAKVFQNGKYDNAYLTAWGAPIYNWLYDTANLFHSWYSELPKDLGFLQAFLVRKAAYWKDLSRTSDLHEYYKYNALDTWATAMAALAAIREMPQWAIDNYANEFPLNFPCHLCEMTGIPRDLNGLAHSSKQQDAIIDSNNTSLNTMLGVQNFNSGSPIQKKQLLTILGYKPAAGRPFQTDEKTLKRVSYLHPLNARILDQVTKVSKAKKLKSTYLTKGKEYNGVILSALNPHGTDTGRLASKEHHFWCGLNIQNIPRGRHVKQTLVAFDGFRIAECDLEQAESRDTANISGDESLINAVSGEKDFHSVNAAAFFGVTYDSIYDAVARKTRDSDRRDIGKKVNHGANYNMGPQVMVDTIGEESVYKAGRLLNLPRFYSALQIADHLIGVFHKTYPGLRGIYYPAVISEIVTTGMLSSRATHEVAYQAAPAGLVRFCFSDPTKSKPALNAYIAHAPQSLNARTLNKAFMKVLYEIAIHPEHKYNFKLIAQVHDSILFMFREGHEYLAEMVKQAMEIEITIRSYDEKTRTFTVPAAIKAGKDGKGVRSWADI